MFLITSFPCIPRKNMTVVASPVVYHCSCQLEFEFVLYRINASIRKPIYESLVMSLKENKHTKAIQVPLRP